MKALIILVLALGVAGATTVQASQPFPEYDVTQDAFHSSDEFMITAEDHLSMPEWTAEEKARDPEGAARDVRERAVDRTVVRGGSERLFQRYLAWGQNMRAWSLARWASESEYQQLSCMNMVELSFKRGLRRSYFLLAHCLAESGGTVPEPDLQQ